MQKIVKFIVAGLIMQFHFQYVNCKPVSPPCTGCAKLEGRIFKINGVNFYPIGAEYLYNITHDITPATQATDYYLARNPKLGPQSEVFEHHTPISCYQEIIDDLTALHNMGFNTIRTHGIGPTFKYHGWQINCQTGFVQPALFNNGGNPLSSSTVPFETCMFISTDPNAGANDPEKLNRDRLFLLIQQVLETAHASSLKVILDVGYYEVAEPNNIQAYLNYLNMLGSFIRNLPLNLRETLLAYNIMEEPIYEGPDNHNKQFVCDAISRMYDALKATDSEHLISVGGAPTFDEIFSFDPGVMKLDFWSPHIYPFPLKDIEPNADEAVKRVKKALFWYKQNCPMPYLIGETAFCAIDDEPGNSAPNGWPAGRIHYPLVDGETDAVDNANQNILTHGEYYHQKNYAEEILNKSFDCEASGILWWDIQELDWTVPDGNVAIPTTSLKENGNGLLRHGDITDPLVKKPVVSACSTYVANSPHTINPSNGGPEPNQNTLYPAFLYDQNYTISGMVVEEGTNNPINGAIVSAQTEYYTSTNSSVKKNSMTSFSNIGVINMNTIHPNAIIFPFSNSFNPKIMQLAITSIGAERKYDGYWFTGQSYPSTINCSLKISPFAYDLEMVNEVVSPSISQKNFRGWNSINESFSTIQSGAASDIKARNEINLHREFHAEFGSETHIFCTTDLTDCSIETDNFNKLSVENSNTITNSEVSSNNESIEIKFLPKTDFLYMEITPNPSDGIFLINLESNDPNSFAKIRVIDMIGKVVFIDNFLSNKIKIDLTGSPSGMYQVQVLGSEKTISQKIIIN